MDFARAKALGSIQRDQHPPAQTLERIEHARCRDRFEEQRIERRRLGAVEHQADIGVGWNGGHAEQGLAVRPAMSFGERALMAQERGASHEKHRERRETDVGQGVFTITARSLAPIRQTGADSFQLSDQGLQGRHRGIESKIAPRRQAKSSRIPAESEETRGPWHFRLTLTGAVWPWKRAAGSTSLIKNETHSQPEPLVLWLLISWQGSGRPY